MLEEERGFCLNSNIFRFGGLLRSPDFRRELRRYAEHFFGSTEIPFVAIDGSCDSRPGEGFITLYGGA
jgi:hypothetical protein